jgi:hypothetical protein
MSAIKRAMGIRGRYAFVSDIGRWLRAHPSFRVADVYPSKHRQSSAGPGIGRQLAKGKENGG